MVCRGTDLQAAPKSPHTVTLFICSFLEEFEFRHCRCFCKGVKSYLLQIDSQLIPGRDILQDSPKVDNDPDVNRTMNLV